MLTFEDVGPDDGVQLSSQSLIKPGLLAVDDVIVVKAAVYVTKAVVLCLEQI